MTILVIHMRLHILSDLHLEFEPELAIPVTDDDVVVLAGCEVPSHCRL